MSCRRAGQFCRKHAAAVLVQATMGAILGLLVAKPSVVQADTRVIPALTISERYDSNVWFFGTPPGATRFDYATNVSPQVNIQHRGRLAEGTITGGGVGEFYVNNPALNYVGANALMDMKLDQLAQKLDRRLELSASDAFFFTNQLQPFVNPVAGQSPTFAGSAVGSGIQAFRVTTTANVAKVRTAYNLSPLTSLQATYGSSFVRFGGTFGDPTLVRTFGITSHSLTAGPQWKITPRDTVGANYAYTTAEFVFPGGGNGSEASFSTHGGTATYTRILTPTLTADFTGGAMVLAQDFGGPNFLYVTSAALLWNLEENTALTVAYSRAVVPSFFVVPVPLISNVGTLSAQHRLTEKLRATAVANFSHNEDTASIVSYQSYGGTLALSYDLTRSVTTTVSYTYYNFDSNFPGLRLAFDRNMLMFSIRAAWN